MTTWLKERWQALIGLSALAGLIALDVWLVRVMQ